MDWAKHFAIGFALSATAFYFLSANPYEIIVFSLFSGGSSLLPDLDHVNSKVREILDKLIIFIAVIFTYFFHCPDYSCIFTENFLLRAFAFAGAYFLVFAYFRPKHRGITHTFTLAAFFSLFVYFVLGFKFALAGAIGYISHLLADRQIKLL